jgi:hypothetical protein
MRLSGRASHTLALHIVLLLLGLIASVLGVAACHPGYFCAVPDVDVPSISIATDSDSFAEQSRLVSAAYARRGIEARVLPQDGPVFEELSRQRAAQASSSSCDESEQCVTSHGVINM